MRRLTSVVVLALVLNGSSCLSRSIGIAARLSPWFQDLGEVEGYPDMNVGKSSSVMTNVFEEEFWLREVEALRVDELRIWIRKLLAMAHFEEAVDDEDEFREIGGNSSAKDIFLTLATDFLTEAPALEHRFRNSARPNWEAPVLRSL